MATTLRKLSVTVPSVSDMTESPAVEPKETLFTPPVWEHDDYSPASPTAGTWDGDYTPTVPHCPLKCSYGSREHIKWIIDTAKF